MCIIYVSAITEHQMTATSRTLNRDARKIDVLGLVDHVVSMLVAGLTMQQIANQLNTFLEEEGSNERVSNSTVWRWVKQQPEAFKEEIAELKKEVFTQQVLEWEARALSVREGVMEQIDNLIKDELENGQVTARTKGGQEYKRDMTLGEKKDLANIIMKKINVQESGERFVGIGSKEGKRYGVDVNIQVDFVGDLKDKIRKKLKPGSIDVKGEEVEDS